VAQFEPYFDFRGRLKPYLSKRRQRDLLINVGFNRIWNVSLPLEHMPVKDQVQFLSDLLDAWDDPLVKEEDKPRVKAELIELLGEEVAPFIGMSYFYLQTTDSKTLACTLEMPKRIFADRIGQAKMLFEIHVEDPALLQPFLDRLVPIRFMVLPTDTEGVTARLFPFTY
jgi:hypothetical protein